MSDYEIRALETKKNKIPLLGVQKVGILPKTNTTSIIIGRTGSGKSQLLLNLMTRSEFFGKSKKYPKGYFNQIHVFSPTAKSDDIYENLELGDEFLHTKLSTSELGTIMEKQKKDVTEKGSDKADRVCIIFDDILGNIKFLNSHEFSETIIANRHYNFTVFILTQSYKHIPRKVRNQARYLFYFAGSENENMILAEDIAPPRFTKKETVELIHFATEDKFSFIYINTSETDKSKAYRKNLTRIIDIYNQDFDDEEE